MFAFVHTLPLTLHAESIILICSIFSSGTGRTGVFIALSNVFERLRQESVVDMFATVKRLRQQRIGLVQTEEQYRFCYLATLDYLTSFDLCTQPAQTERVQISAFGSPCPQSKFCHVSITNT